MSVRRHLTICYSMVICTVLTSLCIASHLYVQAYVDCKHGRAMSFVTVVIQYQTDKNRYYN